MVTGDAPALKQVFQFMTEKTYEFPVPKDMAIINGDRHKQVNFFRPSFFYSGVRSTGQTIRGQSLGNLSLTGHFSSVFFLVHVSNQRFFEQHFPRNAYF